MKFILSLVVAASLIASVARAGPAEDAVRAADGRRIDGLLHANRPVLEAVLADDLTYGHSDGRRQTKAELLAALAGGAVKYESYDAPVPVVTVAGDVAWINGAAALVASAGGKRVRMELRYLAVYRKTGDDWRMVAYQSTPIVPPAVAPVR